MVFWRSKSSKNAEAADAKPATKAAETAGDGSAKEDDSNVVSIAPSRLADRLADVKPKSKTAVARKDQDEPVILASDPLLLPGQAKPLSTMRDAVKDTRPAAHLLILGAEGTGRRWAAEKLATLHAEDMPAPADWVYVPDPERPSRLLAFEFAPGEGVRFARDVNVALANAWATRARILESDDHRLARDLLDEEVRHRGDAALEHLRRRAEAQNIALVKSIDGYVLAPMHEGRMVRPEIFRALPEALQRDVEAKITALEGELHGLVVATPEAELEAIEKYAALDRHVAMSAAKPNLALARKLYSESESAPRVVDLIERSFLDAAARGAAAPASISVNVFAAACGASLSTGAAPVILARSVARRDLLGEIGHDTSGNVAIAPGRLMDANGGFLVVEAWRLAADPTAWQTLCEVMDTGKFAPLSSSGLAVSADTVPFTAKVVVIADPRSWNRLKELDPGAERRFRHVAKFADTAPAAEVGEPAFSAAAATIARENGLRTIYASAGSILYADAVKRGGGPVSLDRGHLLRLLEEADGFAASASADHIRAGDVRRAVESLSVGATA